MTTSWPAFSPGALGLDHLQALVADRAGVLGVERGLLADPRRRAADVERPHRQLRARLADRLRRDDADRQAQLDELARRQVAAVALRAAAAAARAGQHRADADLLDARLLDRRGLLLVDLLVLVDDRSRPMNGSVIRSSVTRPMMRSRSGSMISPDSTIARASMPSIVPQSISWMMTSCATSTRRRVR